MLNKTTSLFNLITNNPKNQPFTQYLTLNFPTTKLRNKENSEPFRLQRADKIQEEKNAKLIN